MNKKNLFLIFFSLCCFSIIALLLISIEWEEVEQEVGLTKKASVDPLLAARLFLEQKNIIFSTLTEKEQFFINDKITLPANRSLIINEAVLNEYIHIESAILEWVKAGGHLIYVLSSRRDVLVLNENKLLTASGVSVTDAENSYRRYGFLEQPKANLELEIEDDTLALNLPHYYYFTGCEGESFQLKGSEATLLCELSLSQGFITFLPSLHQFSNSSLRHLDHGQFLLWLVGSKKGLFYLPSMNESNWLISLWDWSWQVIILISLTIIIVMWNAAIRLGLPTTPTHSMKNLFADHIEAVGNLMISQNHHAELKKALLKDLEYVIEKRNPAYKKLTVSQQAGIISQFTGKNSDEIEQLLIQPLPVDDVARLQYIKLFRELRDLL